MAEDLISVIVPVYNAEKYLEECIQSICQQSYKNLEIILVNDGSSDSSGQICDQMAAQDHRIKVIHKENGGAGSAQNLALDQARGDYIAIVDADDIAKEEQLATLYQQLQAHDADLAIGNYYVYNEQDGHFYYYLQAKDLGIELLTPQQAIDRQLKWHLNTSIFIVPWCKLAKRSLYDHVRFPERRRFYDEFTTHKLYLGCKKIVLVNDNLHIYRQGHESMMGSAFDLSWTEDVVLAFEEKLADLTLAGLDLTVTRQRFINILRDFKERMEKHQLTDSLAYSQLLYRLSLLEDYGGRDV